MLQQILIMQVKKPDINRMWGCMWAGDLAIRQAGSKAIIICGDSRVGKSTLFNHLLKVPMRGQQVKRQVRLKFSFEDTESAKMAQCFESVTLIPNINKVSLNNENIFLLDTAGFNDEARSYIGTFGVSYMLQKIFQVLKQVKIILVITHVKFEDQQISKQIDPIIKFVGILQTHTLLTDKQIAQKLYNCIAFVVIKSREQPDYYLGAIQQIIQNLKKDKNISNERKVALAIFQNVYKNKRLQVFKRGEHNVDVEDSVILQNLSKKKLNWEFFSFQQDLQSNNIFSLPFKHDYQRMANKDKEEYKKQVQNKNNFIKDSLILMKSFVTKATEDNNWYLQEIDYSKEFEDLKTLIKNHPYGDISLMLQHLKIKLQIPEGKSQPVSRLKLLDYLKQIEKASRKISTACDKVKVLQKIKAVINPQDDLYFNFFNLCKKCFSSTREEEINFLIFMFINHRSIEQTFMQCIIDDNSCSEIPQMIKKVVNTIMPKSIQNLIAQFTIGFKHNEKEQIGNKSLISMSQTYISNIDDPEIGKRLFAKIIQSKMKQADKKIKAKQYIDGLKQLFETNNKFQQYLSLLGDDDQQNEETKQQCEFKQLLIFKKIGSCLQKMKLNREAISIYEHTHSTFSILACYERMIKQCKKTKRKIQTMEDYASVLQKYGKKERLVALYEEMIDKAICYPAKRWALQQKLHSLLITDLSYNVNEYIDQLQDKKPVKDNSALLSSIENELDYYENPISDKQSQSDEDLDAVFKEQIIKRQQIKKQNQND